MATYVSKRQRQRRLITAVVAAAIVASAGGWVVGRASVPTVTERVTQARASGEELATRISALTIEYEQAVGGRGDSVAAGVLQPLTGITADLDVLLSRAEWVGSAEADRVRRLVKAVTTAAGATVGVSTFEQVAAAAAEALRGLTP